MPRPKSTTTNRGVTKAALDAAAVAFKAPKAKATPLKGKAAVPAKRMPTPKAFTPPSIDLDALAEKIADKQLARSAPKTEVVKDAKTPMTALSINMQQVDHQFGDLEAALSVLAQKLQPVLNQTDADSDGEPSQVEYEGNSSVNSFLRGVAGRAETLTARIKALTSLLEI